MGKIDVDKLIIYLWGNTIHFDCIECALENQGLKIVNGEIMLIEDKKEPKFKVGDKIRRKTPRRYDKDMQVARVESNHYICNHIGQFSSESIPFSEESNYELVKQSPADEIESKFKVGDWVTNGIGFTFQVRSIEDNMYLRSDDYFIDIETADKTFRLWTIQDAKAGDVLLSITLQPFIFNGHINEGRFFFCGSYCGIDSIGGFRDYGSNLWTHIKGVVPADEEQRDLLFQKMHEAGYKWNAEKLKLEKIEQKQEWSEEDEAGLSDVLWAIEQARTIAKDENDMGNLWCAEHFAKSLKDRIQPQPHWKPSDKQMEQLGWIAEQNKDNMIGKELMSLYQDLKKLREE